MSGQDVIAVYDAQAAELADRYDRIGLLEAYAGMGELIAPAGIDPLALDVGAGSGRDAAWLAAQGYEVVAVEPAAGMRAEGQQRHPDAKVRWLDDRLPGLVSVHGLALGFDLILLSAVWQHVAPTDRPRAFRKLVTLLRPGGLMLMTLRHGPAPVDRPMHPVSLSEVEGLSRVNGIEVLRVVDKSDAMARSDVRWTMVALRMPDDGAGALPLIRGIILADDKSSTYKLALLRAVARIAEHAPATAVPAGDDTDAIDVPLGLVALFWVRMYLPLLRAGLPQAPRNSGPDGLGFAKAGFRALLDQAFLPQDLRVGATFTGERARSVHAAIGEAATTIVTMPANFIRFPNSDHRVFGALRARAGRTADLLQLDVAILSAWGHLRIPGHVWRAMVRLGAWIEPVLVAEWTRLIRNYGERMGYTLPIGQAEAALAWEEPIRDTAIGRMAAERLLTASMEIQCVWSAANLGMSRLDIDHCLPWAAWPCGDLWNLLPSDRRVNQHQKRDRLPSAGTLRDARDRILDWWEKAWLSDPALRGRFEREIAAALPVADPADPEQVFAAVEWRRLRLRQDQQVPEWHGAGSM